MYFIPQEIDTENQGAITPNILRDIDPNEAGYSSLQEVGYASDWQVIEELITNDTLDALIVHHAVMEAVDWQTIGSLFQQKGLIVAGIGIPGDELASRLGMPSLYNRVALEEQDFDFFIYSIHVTGEPDDVEKFLNSDLNSDESVPNIAASASFRTARSHGYFSEGRKSVMRFLGLLDGALQTRIQE
jgi:hypothetical protein